MAGGSKEIRAKIASVTNTKKITKAMEMVAASKMRKRKHAWKPHAHMSKSEESHQSRSGAHLSISILIPRFAIR